VIYSDIKGVIFDLGSTLVEYENRSWADIGIEGQRLGYDALKEAGENDLPDFDIFNDRLEEIKNEFRVKARSELIEWKATDAPEKYFGELGLDNISEKSRDFIDVFYTRVRDQLTLEEGAVETLAALKEAGIKLGLISNTIFLRHQHEGDIEHFGLLPYLPFRIYSSEFGKRKPHADIFREGLHRIGLAAGEVAYVGDRYLEDVTGPLNVGMKAVLKHREGREYPETLPYGVSMIKALPELISMMNK